MDLTFLIRPDILTMQAYKPIVPFDVLSKRLGRDPKDIIKLDANENPYGPSPKALAAIRAVLGEVASGRSLAGAPICQENGIPMVTPSSTNPKAMRPVAAVPWLSASALNVLVPQAPSP